jgi:hypothetical protein
MSVRSVETLKATVLPPAIHLEAEMIELLYLEWATSFLSFEIAMCYCGWRCTSSLVMSQNDLFVLSLSV